MVYFVYNIPTRTARFISAGHPPLIHLSRETQEVFAHRESSAAAGIRKDTVFMDHSFQVKEGDRIYLYSDGINEALNEDDQMFDTEGLQRAVKESLDKTLEQSVQCIIEQVRAWNGNGRNLDDMAVLAMEVSGT